MTSSEDAHELEEQVARGTVIYWQRQVEAREELAIVAKRSLELAKETLHSAHQNLARVHHRYTGEL